MTTPRVLLRGALLMASESAAAHGGGLDATGCHQDRKHGGYQCHRGNAALSPTPNFAPTPMPSQRLSGDDSDFIYYANCSATDGGPMGGIWTRMGIVRESSSLTAFAQQLDQLLTHSSKSEGSY